MSGVLSAHIVMSKTMLVLLSRLVMMISGFLMPADVGMGGSFKISLLLADTFLMTKSTMLS